MEHGVLINEDCAREEREAGASREEAENPTTEKSQVSLPRQDSDRAGAAGTTGGTTGAKAAGTTGKAKNGLRA